MKNDIANFIRKTDFDNKLKNVISKKKELKTNYQRTLKKYQQKN